jgi:hypothetical protein
MERLIAVSANAIVSILTLTVIRLPPLARQPSIPSSTELIPPAAGPHVAWQRTDAT